MGVTIAVRFAGVTIEIRDAATGECELALDLEPAALDRLRRELLNASVALSVMRGEVEARALETRDEANR